MHCTTQMRPQDRAHGTEIKPRSINFTVLTLSTFLDWYFQSFSTTEFLPLICDYTLIVQMFKLFQIVEEVHKSHNTFSPNSLLYHHIWLNSYTRATWAPGDHTACRLQSPEVERTCQLRAGGPDPVRSNRRPGWTQSPQNLLWPHTRPRW